MKKSALTATITALALAAGAGIYAWNRRAPELSVTGEAPSFATATVVRTDLTTKHLATCTVGFGDTANLVTTASGTVTELPGTGQVIRPGETLFRIDDEPVTLLNGELPAWRDFTSGMSAGRDISQLKVALAELGFADAAKLGDSDTWTWRLAEAIRDFNEARGLTRSSDLPAASIVFLPTDIRVASTVKNLGETLPAGGQVIQYTRVDSSLDCALDTSAQGYAVPGSQVTIEFAGLTPTTGTIGDVTEKSGSGPGESDWLEVTIIPSSASIFSNDDGENFPDSGGNPPTQEIAAGQTARVTFTDTVASDVLAIPVTALVAFVTGGFGVQVPLPDGGFEYHDVEVGQFADTMVAITSANLTAGAVVVVPK